MSWYYVQHDGKWNIFSSIVDDFVFPEFVPFADLKKFVCDYKHKQVDEENKKLDSLLTDKPRLNVMSYEEAMVEKAIGDLNRGANGEREET